MVLFIPHSVVDCGHAFSSVGVYFIPISIKIIDVPVSGCKMESGAKGGKKVVGT